MCVFVKHGTKIIIIPDTAMKREVKNLKLSNLLERIRWQNVAFHAIVLLCWGLKQIGMCAGLHEKKCQQVVVLLYISQEFA